MVKSMTCVLLYHCLLSLACAEHMQTYTRFKVAHERCMYTFHFLYWSHALFLAVLSPLAPQGLQEMCRLSQLS